MYELKSSSSIQEFVETIKKRVYCTVYMHMAGLSMCAEECIF